MKILYKRSLPFWSTLFILIGGVVGTSSFVAIFIGSGLLEVIKSILFTTLGLGFALSGIEEIYYRFFYFMFC